MATLLEPAAPVRDFQSLFARARRSLVAGAGDVRDLRLDLEGPPLHARSRLLSSGPLLFVRGENEAAEDMVLRHVGSAPIVAVHVALRGSATSSMDGLGAALSARAGEVQLFASPSSHSTVRLRAHDRNEAFRVIMSPSWILSLAESHPALAELAAHVAAGKPFCASPVAALPLARLLQEATEAMNSAHYGAQQSLLLESHALGWLALALARPEPLGGGQLSADEVDRMHAARDLLLARLDDPPTLREIARAVGTNEFALKRNFKRLFGRPVHAYLLGVRLAWACSLLRDSSDSLKQIAARVGYAHANHFVTAFRRMYGTTPARYRDSARMRR